MNRLFDRVHLRPASVVLNVVLAVVALLSGCEGNGPGRESQVAAKVNQGEISVHQVQYVLERQARATREQPALAARKILDNLVEQELAAQAARAEGLDHDPSVVQALQLAEREVLARAYQDRLASKARSPTSDEIDSYYDNNPALFERRRLYLIQETAVVSTPSQLDEIRSIARRASGTAEVAEQLRGKSYHFETRQFVQAAESLPFGLLGPMAQLSNGQSIVVPQAEGVRIFTVVHAQTAAVDRRRATEAIAAYLGAERRGRLVAEGMKELRSVASIRYQGTFAESPASAPTAPQQTTN